jgi:lipid A 3-O-deacylase
MARWSRLSVAEMSGLHGLVFAMAMGFLAPVHAAEPAGNTKQWTLAMGVLAHDSGPFSDHHENGADLNLEAQFAPLNVLGSPRPHLGVAANFQGNTSVAYAGLGFRLRETTQWFVDGLLGVAVHDGPLHKDPVGCQLYSDCGYGTRFLPRFGLEAGYRVSPVASVSILFDHMSHKWLVAGENEGLDHVGLRYLRAY